MLEKLARERKRTTVITLLPPAQEVYINCSLLLSSPVWSPHGGESTLAWWGQRCIMSPLHLPPLSACPQTLHALPIHFSIGSPPVTVLRAAIYNPHQSPSESCYQCCRLLDYFLSWRAGEEDLLGQRGNEAQIKHSHHCHARQHCVHGA